jgi:TldD protein
VRAISGEKTAFAYSDDISLDALGAAADATRAIARAGQNRQTAIARAPAAASCTTRSIRC